MAGKHSQKPSKNKKGPLTRFRLFLKTPKAHAMAALIVLTVVGSLTPVGKNGLSHAAQAVTAAIVFDALVAIVAGRRPTLSTGGIITGLIVADVLSGLTPWYVVVLTTLIALASKHLLKRGRKPIFNPAAVGLLVSLGVFSSAQSWWAGMPLMSWWHLPVLLAAGIYVATRVQKYAQVLVFAGTYVALVLAMAMYHLGLASATPADALRPPLINAALFFAFFMLTDPPSTPGNLRGQIPFSIIVAAVSVLVYDKVGGLAYLLVGLLAGNVWTVVISRKKAVRKSTAPARGELGRERA